MKGPAQEPQKGCVHSHQEQKRVWAKKLYHKKELMGNAPHPNFGARLGDRPIFKVYHCHSQCACVYVWGGGGVEYVNIPQCMGPSFVYNIRDFLHNCLDTNHNISQVFVYAGYPCNSLFGVITFKNVCIISYLIQNYFGFWPYLEYVIPSELTTLLRDTDDHESAWLLSGEHHSSGGSTGVNTYT